MPDLSSEIARHLYHLSVEIGPRPSGSAGNHAAANYIQGVMTSAGLDIEEQSFPCPAWVEEETTLSVDGKLLEAAANPYSPPCDISAPVVPLGTLAVLESADLEGRIAVLYGDLTGSPLAAKAWIYKGEREAEIPRLLEEKRPAALIAVQSRPGSLERLTEDWEFPIPAVTVPARTGLALLNGPAAVHLRIAARLSSDSTSNIVGRLSGRSGARIVLCAHYDTKVDTPGANDNGAGVATLLALAGELGKRDLSHGLEFIAFTNEEYLPLGGDEYMRRAEGSLDSILAVINFDGIGPALGVNSITMLASAKGFQDQVAELTTAYPETVWVEPWIQSDHALFAFRGIPSIAFTTKGAPNLAHLRADTVEWISPAKCNEAASLALQIIDCLQTRSIEWTREMN